MCQLLTQSLLFAGAQEEGTAWRASAALCCRLPHPSHSGHESDKSGNSKGWFTGWKDFACDVPTMWKKHYLPNLPQRRPKVAPQKDNSCLLMISRPWCESSSIYTVFHPQAFLRPQPESLSARGAQRTVTSAAGYGPGHRAACTVAWT